MASKGRITKRWINLDYNDPESLNAKNIPYDTFRSIDDVLQSKIDQGLPIPVSRVGDLIYLPLDLKSKFNGIQIVPDTIIASCMERDGAIVSLRMGTDGVRNYCLYNYSLTGFINDQYITDIEYKPSTLSSTEYISEIIDANKNGVCATVFDTSANTSSLVWLHSSNTFNDSNISSQTEIPINALSCIYISELDQYLCLTDNSNLLTLTLYDNTFTEVTSLDWFNFGDSSYCSVAQYNGSDYVSFGYRDKITLSYYYDPDTKQVHIYTWVGLSVSYLYSDFKGHIVLTATIDNGTISSNLNIPVSYDPNVDAYPVFPTSGLYDYVVKVSNIKNDYAIVSLIGNNDVTSFKQIAYKDEVDNILDVVANDGHFTSDSIIANKTFIPTDVTLLGKELYNARWFGDDKIICKSIAKLEGDESLTTRTISIDTDVTARRTIFNADDALPLPTDLSDDIIDPIANATTFVITSAGDKFGVDIDKSIINKVDTAGNITPIVSLPVDFDTQIKSLIFDATYDTVDYWVYSLADSYLVITYILWNSSNGEYTLNFTIASISGTTVSLETTTPTNITSGVDKNLDITKAKECISSSGNYIDYTTMIAYSIFTSYPDVGVGHSYPILLAYDMTNNVIVNKLVTSPIENEFHPTCTINYMLGPQACQSIKHNAQIQAMYIDNTSNTVLTDRLVACFTDWLNATAVPSHLYIATIETPTGYKLYLPETPVFIKGVQNRLPTQSIDITDFVSSSFLSAATECYVGVEYNGTNTDIFASQLPIQETYNKTQIAKIYLDSTGITSITIEPQSRVDIYKPSITPTQYGIPVSKSDGQLDRKWVPYLLQATNFQYFPATTGPQNSIKLNQKLFGGVVQLVEVTSQLYHAVITFPEQFESPPLVIPSLTNTADGYTGAGGIDTISTWIRFEAANITESGCVLSLTFGDVVSGLTIFAHWIAIGQ